MFIRIKKERIKPLGIDQYFQDPSAIMKVYMHDLSGATQYFMVKCDTDEGAECSGDRSGTPIFYEDPELEWDKDNYIKGYTHIQERDCDVIELLDNEGYSNLILQSMEAFV